MVASNHTDSRAPKRSPDHAADFRFYEELNDFLPRARRKRSFTHRFDGAPAVKDTIESLGVPHTEVDLILVDGQSVTFAHRLHGGERVAVYPVFERLDVRPLYRLRSRPLRHVRFVADVHLGALARRLRLLGFDTVYERQCDDACLANISARDQRVLLTRDVGLLKRGIVTHGHWVRSTNPEEQVVEIVRALSLQRDLNPFTRCTLCNGELRPAERAMIADRLPPRVRARYRRFMECIHCGQLYWRGSHYRQLVRLARTCRSQG